ncbi:MAG TPA: divergent polysaccharide deacetylase family protein [Candidatus Eisenbacteria bacterium]|nr:divergent polysaccharide deacetylase family protein [Candidatus Eisenbacteria bacterium]
MIGIGVVLLGVVIWLAQNGPSLKPAPRDEPAHAAPDRDADAGADASADARNSLVVDSDWDRLRLRAYSEYIRLFRGDDRAELLRLTSRTLRGALEQIGISRERIDERPLPVAGAGKAPVHWRIQVPPRASLPRINDAVTQSMIMLGGRVLRGAERPARLLGTALDLRVGYGDRVTHAIAVEPSASIVDAGAKVAFIVTDLDSDEEALHRAFVRSEIPFTFAVRPDRPGAAREAKALREAKREVFLSLAMEPRGYPRVDPGKDAILLDHSRIEIEDRIARSLSAIGPTEGVISRMGSAAVNDADVMRAVLLELRHRDLPFVDAHGAGPSVAEQIGEDVGARVLTLGGNMDGSAGSASAARARLKQIAATATQRGALVVSIRANATLLTVIEEERANLRAQGLEIVPASELIL